MHRDLTQINRKNNLQVFPHELASNANPLLSYCDIRLLNIIKKLQKDHILGVLFSSKTL